MECNHKMNIWNHSRHLKTFLLAISPIVHRLSTSVDASLQMRGKTFNQRILLQASDTNNDKQVSAVLESYKFQFQEHEYRHLLNLKVCFL